jgi:hypothetical protein
MLDYYADTNDGKGRKTPAGSVHSSNNNDASDPAYLDGGPLKKVGSKASFLASYGGATTAVSASPSDAAAASPPVAAVSDASPLPKPPSREGAASPEFWGRTAVSNDGHSSESGHATPAQLQTFAAAVGIPNEKGKFPLGQFTSVLLGILI